MIEIKDLNALAEKNSHELIDINLTLPESGMIFIIDYGKNQSALLNLISGLDKAEYGEIIIRGKSLKYFNSVEFEAYRSSIGMILANNVFLNNLTLKDNIAISIESEQYGRSDDYEIDYVLDLAGIKNLKDVKIKNLNYNERRLATFARALVNSPEIILMDMPVTESNTKLYILDKLKDFSKNKLVIVSTKDVALANRYADRIIKINAGRIIEDSGSQITHKSDKVLDLNKKPDLTPNKILLLSSYNLKRRPVTFFFSFLLLLLIFSVILCGYTFTTYDKYDTYHQVIDEYEDNDVLSFYYSDNYWQFNTNLPSDFVSELNERYPDNNYLLSYYSGDHNIIIGDPAILGYQISDNSLPLDEDSIYITDIFANLIKKYYYIKKNDRIIDINNNFDILDFVGETIYDENYYELFKVNGIIITGEFDPYREDGPMLNAYQRNKLCFKSTNYYYNYFGNADYLNKHYVFPSLITYNHNLKMTTTSTNFTVENDYLEIKNINDVNSNYLTYDGKIVTVGKLSLKRGEIVLSLDQYNCLFGTSLTSGDVDTNHSLIKHLGETIDFSIKDKDNNVIFELNNVIFKGIALPNEQYPDPYDNFYAFNEIDIFKNIYLSSIDYQLTADIPPFLSNIYTSNPNGYDTFEDLRNLASGYEVSIGSPILKELSNYDLDSYVLSIFFWVYVAAIFVIFLILLWLKIRGIKRKDISLLKSQGVSNKDLIKISLIESFAISIILFIFLIILLPINVNLVNFYTSTELIDGLNTVSTPLNGYVFISIAPFLLMLIPSILPILKIIRTKPIEVTR